MEYYSAIKRNENDLFVVRGVDLESVIQSEVRKRKTNTVCECIYMKCKKKKKKKKVLMNLVAGQE